jgi:hypothetical protein
VRVRSIAHTWMPLLATLVASECQTPVLDSDTTKGHDMTVIIINDKPETGRRQRSCNVCGDPYYTTNLVHCGCAVKPYTVVEAWRGTSFEVR